MSSSTTYRILLLLLISLPYAAVAQTVGITKSVDKTTAQSGETITFSLDVGCSSLVGDCEGAIMRDTLPLGTQVDNIGPLIIASSGGNINIPGSYDVGTGIITWDFTVLPENGLPAGAAASVNYEVSTVPGTTANNTVIENKAGITSTNAGSDTDSKTVTINAAADWTLTKTVTTGLIYHDRPVNYEIVLCPNSVAGNLNLTTVQVSDALPPGADFISADRGGTWNNNDPGTVVWTLPTAAVDQPCEVFNVVVEYPESDQVVNNTGLSNTIPKLNEVVVDATPVGEAPTVYNASAADPLNPPYYELFFQKTAYDNGIIVDGKSTRFELRAENRSTAVAENFLVTDQLPDQLDLTNLEYNAANSASDPLTIRVKLNGGLSFIDWVTNHDPEVSQVFDVTTIPGFVDGTDYVSEIQIDYGTAPPDFYNTFNLVVNAARYPDGSGGYVDNAGNVFDDNASYTNCADLAGERALDSSQIGPENDCASMAYREETTRLDPQKTVAIDYLNPPAGNTTQGNPYYQNSRIKYTLVVENDGSDGVTAFTTGATSFDTLINPIAADLLPAEVTYEPGSYVLIDNTTGLVFDNTGGNPSFEEIDNFNGTGRKLLRWSFTGDFEIGESVTIEFNARIDQGTPENTVLTNEYALTMADSTFLCDETANGTTTTTGLNDFFNTTSGSGSLISGVTEACFKNVSITVDDSTAYLAPNKALVSTGPYAPTGTNVVDLGLSSDIMSYELTIANHDSANIVLPNPVAFDLLPEQITYIPGSLALVGGSNNTGLSLDDSGTANPIITITDDYNGTGRTLLKLEFTGDFPIGSGVKYRFDSRIKAGASGFVDNILLLKTDDQNYECQSYRADTEDVDGDGNTTETFCRSPAGAGITIQTVSSLKVTKFVRGPNESYQENPDIANTTPNDSVWFKVKMFNPGNVTLNNLKLVDVFPFLNDKGVKLNTTDRGSKWAPYLIAPVSVAPGVNVYYSQSNDPAREEVEPVASTAGNTDDWSLVAPGDLSLVKAIRLEFTNAFNPVDSFEFELKMFSPDFNTNIANNDIAYNSVAFNADELPSQEPNRVGIRYQYYDLDLRKSLAPGQAATVSTGEDITFRLRIRNRGSFPVNNILLTDYIPTGTLLNDPDWTSVNDTTATYLYTATINPGQTRNVDITLQPQYAGIDASYVNYAEISDFEDTAGVHPTDYDSTPDQDETNDVGEDDFSDEPFSVFPCSLKLHIFYTCDDAGTINDLTDDTYTLQFEPYGTSLGATYDVTGDITATAVPYGSFQSVGTIYATDGPNNVITIIDNREGGNGCRIENYTVPHPKCGLTCPEDRPLCKPISISRL